MYCNKAFCCDNSLKGRHGSAYNQTSITASPHKLDYIKFTSNAAYNTALMELNSSSIVVFKPQCLISIHIDRITNTNVPFFISV